MQLHAVEAGRLGAPRGGGEDPRQHARQFGHVGQVGVGHALAVPEAQRFELARVQHALDRGRVGALQDEQPLADRRVGEPRERRAVAVGEREEAPEEFVGGRASLHRQEVDDLDEQPGCAAARAPDRLDELPEPRQEPIVADAEQRPARDVPHPGGLDHDRARPTPREALVPAQHRGRHHAVVRGAPGHHGRHPGALRQRHGPERDGAEQARRRGLLGGGPAGRGQRVLGVFGGVPHPALTDPRRPSAAAPRASRRSGATR